MDPSRQNVGPAYLDVEPPLWAARGLASLLIALFVAAAAATAIIRVPETVSCPFVLVPRGGTDPVRAARDGSVREVRAAEGRDVGAGETLFVLRSDAVGDRAGELAALKVRLDGARESLANARRKYEKQRLADAEEERRLRERAEHLARKRAATLQLHAAQEKAYRTSLELAEKESEGLRREAEFRRNVRDVMRDQAEKATKLAQTRAISQVEYFQLRLESEKSAVDLERSDRELASARLRLKQLQDRYEGEKVERRVALEELESERRAAESARARLRRQAEVAEREHAELERGLNEEMAKADIRIAALARELESSTGDELAVTAPCSGTVLRLRVRAAGGFVRTGDVLCELAGSGEQLQAELTVPQSGVGRLGKGQRVKLLYDAFPYQRYGARHGSVRWLGAAGVAADGGAGFRALADVDEEAVWAEGRQRPLRAGMAGRAEVVVGRRSLLSAAFEPLRQLRENLAEPPPKPEASGESRFP
jgi:membrane fusion protein